jgi:streptogramin lyase
MDPIGVPGIYRIDPATNQITATIHTETPPTSVRRLGDGLWVNAGPNVFRIDPATNQVTDTLVKADLVGDPGAYLGIGAGSLWLGAGQVLNRIEPTTHQVIASIDVPFPAGRANGDDSMIWLAEANDAFTGGRGITRSMARIDPHTNTLVTTLEVPQNDVILVGEGAVWAIARADSLLYRIDPESNEIVAKIPTGLGPIGLSFGDGYLWIGAEGESSLQRIDPRTNQVVQTVSLPDSASARGGIVVNGELWIAGQDIGAVYRFDL